MKILHIINNLEIGGAQKMLADLAPLMAKYDNINIKIVVINNNHSQYDDTFENAGIEVINLKSSPTSLNTVVKLIPLIREADLLHVHLFAANYLTAIANLFVGKPLIFTEHSTHNKRRNHKWLRPLEKFIYSRFNVVACISDKTKTALAHWIGTSINDRRLITITNGIDISIYQQASQKSSEEIFGRKGIAILMVSRFVESKDQPSVIRALKLIDNPNVFVVFVGDGPLRKNCEQLAQDLEIEDRVVFLGERSDIPEIIKASYLGIQASNWEGFGLTAVEMMAGGIPIIVSDIDGLRNTVGQAALRFLPGDHHQLAKHIQNIINSKNTRESLINLGIQESNNYSITKTAKQYYELYKSMLA